MRARVHLVFVCALAVVAFALLVRGVVFPGLDADTAHLVRGALQLKTCLAAGQLSCEGVSPFALLQHLPVLAASLFSDDIRALCHALSYLNLCCTVALFVAGWRALGRRSRAAGILWILCLAASPLLFYSNRSFSEPLAALLGTLYVAGLLVQASPWRLGVLGGLSAISKESAPLFVLLLAAVPVLTVWRHDRGAAKRLLVGPALGALMGLAVNAAFNGLRFGLPTNDFYLQPMRTVHDAGTMLGFFLAAFVSPSGGVLFFWPVVVFAAIVLAGRRRRLDMAILGGTFALLCLTFAFWHSPFGWSAWGDRLLVPWIPPLVLLLLWHTGEGGRPAAFHGSALVGAALGVVALPQLLVAVNWEWMTDVFRPVPACPVPVAVEVDAAAYYRCLRAYLWPAEPTIVRIFAMLGHDPPLLTLAASYVALFASSLALVRATPKRDGI